MEITLGTNTMANLALDFINLLDETPDKIEARSIIKSTMTDIYEDKIWEMVDSEENGLDLDFSDILNALADDIEDLADDMIYQENNK